MKHLLRMTSQKNVMLATVNGEELEFPDASGPDDVRIGSKVTLNGQPATGEYQLPDGRKFICAGGILKEIKPSANAKILGPVGSGKYQFFGRPRIGSAVSMWGKSVADGIYMLENGTRLNIAACRVIGIISKARKMLKSIEV